MLPMVRPVANTRVVSSAGNEQGTTYSYQSSDITPGLSITCNTLLNTCTTNP